MYDTKPCTSSAGSLQVELLHILFYFFACIIYKIVVSDYRSRAPIYTARVRQCGELN